MMFLIVCTSNRIHLALWVCYLKPATMFRSPRYRPPETGIAQRRGNSYPLFVENATNCLLKTDHVIELGKRPAAALTSIILSLLASPVLAQAADMRIGLAAPLSGTFAPLGNQLAEGARIAAATKGAELVISDDRCDAEGGREAAERFVRE